MKPLALLLRQYFASPVAEQTGEGAVVDTQNKILERMDVRGAQGSMISVFVLQMILRN